MKQLEIFTVPSDEFLSLASNIFTKPQMLTMERLIIAVHFSQSILIKIIEIGLAPQPNDLEPLAEFRIGELGQLCCFPGD